MKLKFEILHLYLLFLIYFPTLECLSSINNNKSRLIDKIANYQKGKCPINEVVNAIETIERDGDKNIQSSCANGLWSLVFSTNLPNKRVNEGFGLLNDVYNNIYQQIFRIAPFLAGSQLNPNDANRQLVVTNQQYIDLSKNILTNTVVIAYKPMKQKFTIKVYGNIIPVDQVNLEAVFLYCNINGINIPLPKPKGLLVTTYCDNDLRISRGGKGGVFVVNRMK